MRYDYIEPLVASTKKVLVSLMHAEITNGETALVKGDDLKGEVSILIALRGDSDGHIIVNLDRDTAARICTVMNGPVVDGSTSYDVDTISELSNMIAGNAASSLNDLGFDFAVYPPCVMTADEIGRKTQGVEVFRVPLGTPCGEISINVALKTN